jgi:3-methyladenine DNA glycosylase AlkD
MARYGISPAGTLGVPIPVLRKMAKEIGRRHDLADALWRSAIHEARILAALIDDPGRVTDDQMERWVLDIDSWDVCNQLCSNLFSRADLARINRGLERTVGDLRQAGGFRPHGLPRRP